MSIAEITRHIESKRRIDKRRLQEKATFDYILASLIGRNFARLHSSSITIPSLEEVYKSLFDDEEIKEERQKQLDEISIIRFKQFTQAYNKKYEEV